MPLCQYISVQISCFRCSYTRRMGTDEGSDQILDIQPRVILQHGCLLDEFVTDRGGSRISGNGVYMCKCVWGGGGSLF